jgi:hypothetical protein
MQETADDSRVTRGPELAMLRKLIWIENKRFQGCACLSYG